jgi:hypothetical protein
MKHDVIFLVGGPAIGSAVCFFVLLPMISVLGGDWHAYNLSMFVSYVITLPIALVLGIVPAGLACVLDAKLLRYRVRHRQAWCAGIGFLVGFIPLAPSFFHDFIHGPYLLAFGLVGALPAGLCSWWAEKASRPKGGQAGVSLGKL